MAIAEYSFVSAADVRAYIDETDTSYDTVLEKLIDACTVNAMNYCGGRRFKVPATDTTEVVSVDLYTNKIWLSNWPIASITSVSYSSGPYNAPVWTAYDAANDYIVNGAAGLITFGSLPAGSQNLQIVYKGGYANDAAVPADLKQAIIEAVAKKFNKRKSQGISSESIGGGSISWEKDEILNAVLDNYRRFL